MPDIASPEIQVIVEDIPDIDLARNNRLGFVISQPLLVLEKDSDPPFRISDSCRSDMMAYLTKALAEATELQSSSRLLIFPEYSVPSDSPDGIGKLLEWMQQGPNDTVIIAGLEPLNETTLRRIEALLPSLKSNVSAQALPQGKFVNCCLILLKTSEGVVRSYLQAKLRPSEREALTLRMTSGDRVFFFRTGRFNFMVLICFDLIGSEANRSLIDELIRKLGACSARPDESINLHAVINIQHNDQPKHETFIDACVKFLRPSPTLNMADGLAIFANSASPDDCLHGMFGRTSLLCQANRWKFPEDEPNLYLTYMPNRDIQVFEFRRRTGGILSFEYRTPAVNTGASGDPRIPLENGCFLLRESAANDWTHEVTGALPLKLRDYLCASNGTRCHNDFTQRLDCSNSDVQRGLATAYQTIRSALISLRRMRVRAICRLLFCYVDDRQLAERSDDWEQEVQGEAIRELARSLSILSLANSLCLEENEIATAKDEQMLYAIIDGNETQPFIYAEALYSRYREKFPRAPARDQQKIVIIANRFAGGAMPDIQGQGVNRPKNTSEGDLQNQPSQRTMKVISASDLHTAQFCDSVEQAVGVLRSHLD